MLEYGSNQGQLMDSLTDVKVKGDRYQRFEKDPLAYMRKTELEKAKELRDITPDVSMMVNLLNITQGLKSDLSDGQITQLLLSKFSFTDDLIEEHLSNLDESRDAALVDQVKFVPRCPTAYREFSQR